MSLKIVVSLMVCVLERKNGNVMNFILGITLRLLNALNSEDRGLKVRFSLATIVFETFELILCQMLSSRGKNAPSHPYPHYLVRLATLRYLRGMMVCFLVFIQ